MATWLLSLIIELRGSLPLYLLCSDVDGAYDNVCFHRVIDGFMAQTGDVEHGDMEDGFNIRRAGTGGSDLPDLPAEFSKLPHDRGTLGAARS